MLHKFSLILWKAYETRKRNVRFMNPLYPEFNTEKIIKIGVKAIEDELISIASMAKNLDDSFADAVRAILKSQGRIVFTGIGKSAIIAQKIVATLNSTGQPALFMHAADAIHGDLGMIQPNDVIAAISKSGNTAEMCTLIPLLNQLGNPLIAIVGNLNSKLARAAHFVLNTTIDKEVCPNNLAPTTSTTAQLIMGDALAVVLMEMRNFKPQDFSKYHPGGALGKSLYLTCGDIANQHAAPFVSPETSWKQAIVSITESRLGATAVIKDDVIIGIITDGDIRRMLAKHDNFNALTAEGIMSPHPQQIEANELATLAAQRMQEHKITQLVVTENGLYKGMVHVHDLYQEGIIS